MEILDQNPSSQKISHCEELLNRIATSLMKNKTVKGEQILVLIYSVV